METLLSDKRSSLVILVLVFVCFAFATTLITARLNEVPPVWYDEGLYAQVADNIRVTGHQFVQTMPGTEVSTRFVTGGYTFLLPTALSFAIVGTNTYAARVPIVLFSLLFLTITFLFVRRLYGGAIALCALLLLVVFPNLYAYGKSLLGEIPGLFFCMCSLFYAYHWQKSEHKRTLGLAMGLFAGLAVATKPIFVLFPIALITSVLLLRILRRQDVLPMGIGLVLPIIAWGLWQFSGSGWVGATLSYYANPYSVTSFWATIISNLARFGSEATPLFFLITLVVWLLAFRCRLRSPEKVVLVELTALLFSLLVFLAYLRTAGWYRYFFIGQTIALIFLPSNINILVQYYFKKRTWLHSLLPVAVSVLLVSILGASLLRSSWVAISWNNNTTELGERYFSSHRVLGCTYLLNVPEVFLHLSHQKYCQFVAPTEVLAFGKEVLLGARNASIGDRIVIRTSEQFLYGPHIPKQATKTTVGPYLVYTVTP